MNEKLSQAYDSHFSLFLSAKQSKAGISHSVHFFHSAFRAASLTMIHPQVHCLPVSSSQSIFPP
jgi:hypothetical protein